MAMTIQFSEGDGVHDDQFNLTIGLGDTNGGTVAINGTATAMGLAQVAVSATPAIPSAPGSGSIFANYQVDPVTGGIAMSQSVSSMPVATVSSNGVTLKRIVYSVTLTASTTDPAADAGVTPDSPVGSV